MDWYEKGMGERFSTFHAVLLAIWLAVLVWSGINPHDRLTWWLECTPGLIGFALLALTWGKFRFSRFCYALIAIHCVILFIGAKYTYAEVPLFTWLEGPLHFARNNYDKVGHFAQGAFPRSSRAKSSSGRAPPALKPGPRFSRLRCVSRSPRSTKSSSGQPPKSFTRKRTRSSARRATPGTRRKTWRGASWARFSRCSSSPGFTTARSGGSSRGETSKTSFPPLLSDLNPV